MNTSGLMVKMTRLTADSGRAYRQHAPAVQCGKNKGSKPIRGNKPGSLKPSAVGNADRNPTITDSADHGGPRAEQFAWFALRFALPARFYRSIMFGIVTPANGRPSCSFPHTTGMTPISILTFIGVPSGTS
jgi:hypothetical protein